jgi:hypothetical protein
VARDPEMTAYKRHARYQQALWRERNGFPIGTHPTRGGSGARPLGSRIEFEFAKTSGANFISENARRAARARVNAPEPRQMLDEARLWADLLSSMPMCFNLLGDLHDDLGLADWAAHRWWPGLPGTVNEVRFEWSPGRTQPCYLGNQTAFDAALALDLGNGTRGVVGIETKYHEHPTKEDPPAPARLSRYMEVTERSGVFRPDALDLVVGTFLQQIWLDHLLVLAMLQHSSDRWAWGRFVLVHPAANVGFARLAPQYAELLEDESTFEARTLEDLLAVDVLPERTATAFSDRYLWPIN